VGAFIGIWGGVYFSTPLSPPSLCVKIFTLRFITQKIKQKKKSYIHIYERLNVKTKVKKVKRTKSEKYKLATWHGNFLHAKINCQCLDSASVI